MLTDIRVLQRSALEGAGEAVQWKPTKTANPTPWLMQRTILKRCTTASKINAE